MRCTPCDSQWSLEEPIFRCPSCGGSQVEVVSGNELEVDTIVLEEREESLHEVSVREGVLDANSTIAAANRADFDRASVSVINLMSSPGAGKTTVLERVLPLLQDTKVGVLEGDVQSALDAGRIAAVNVPVALINTDSGFGGECHLDANMVRSAIPSLPLDEIDLLIVENVGNLVCPAEFRIGEDLRRDGVLGHRR